MLSFVDVTESVYNGKLCDWFDLCHLFHTKMKSLEIIHRHQISEHFVDWKGSLVQFLLDLVLIIACWIFLSGHLTMK